MFWPPLWRVLFVFALILAFVMALVPHPPTVFPVDKEDHGAAFATLAIAAGLGWPRARLIWQFAVMAGLGALIELLQLIPILGRDSDIHDWYADCIAAGIAATLVWAWRRLWPRPLVTE